MGSGDAVNCTFINCYSDRSGGAKYYGYVSDSIFINCSSYSDGGAVYNVNGCYNCEFINCNSGNGGAIYDSSYSNCNFTNCYPGIDSGLSFDVGDITVGSVLNITVNADEKITGNITFKINTTDYDVNFTEGRANVIVSDLTLGKYIVTAVFSGDDVFRPKTVTKEFKVAYDSGLAVSINDAYIDQVAVLNVTFNKNITNDIRVYVDWDLKNFEIDNGKIILNLTDLSEGKRQVNVYFDGNDEFLSKSVEASFNVFKHDADLKITVPEISQTGSADVVITINENVTGDITVELDGVTQSIEFTKGKATLTIPDVGNALHKVKVTYNGDWRFLKASAFDFVAARYNLKDLINNTESGIYLNLKYDFLFNSSDDGNITVDKQITVDGNGHTVDANNLSRIFYITSQGVVLKNIIFKNTISSEENGGAIYSTGYSLEIINCTFINSRCNWSSGGAIYAIYGTVTNSTFINCSVDGDGGAIYWRYSSQGYVYNSTFISCSADYGGAIYSGDTKSDCTFINCSVKRTGIVRGGWGTVYNSKFINPNVTFISYIIYDTSYENCTFELNPDLTVDYGEIVQNKDALITVSINKEAIAPAIIISTRVKPFFIFPYQNYNNEKLYHNKKQ